ncbi:MAG: histone deacetylase [Treponema sp.]|jgi:acetoin utilization deacetylase AcuC-like enzyme|nr:histone deacetylase [Treponema sp.]
MYLLHDPACRFSHRDYGIMLPISPSRADRVAGSLAAAPLDMAAAAGKLRLPAFPVLGREDLERVHSKDFIAALYGESPGGKRSLLEALLNAWELIDGQGRFHRYEPEQATRPLEELFEKVLAQAGGTYLACRLALEAEGFCYYLGGGLHHARYEGGTGFCLLNDIMIAARKIQAEGRAALVWVVDVDAHKGCGTAELIHLARLRGELRPPDAAANAPLPRIFGLSIHMARGWPLDGETLAKARPGHAPLIPSDVEIPIEEGGEARYIPELEEGLRTLERLSRAVLPDLVIVVDGADPYEYDGLPSSSLLKLTLEQCVRRDRLIYDYFKQRNIPQAWLMAGGYGGRAWEPVSAFLSTV